MTRESTEKGVKCSSPGWCGGRDGHYPDCPASTAAMTDENGWDVNDCFSCHENGHQCSPGTQPPVVRCPGEECARCDYAYSDLAYENDERSQ